jgi:hypothetical protein
MSTGNAQSQGGEDNREDTNDIAKDRARAAADSERIRELRERLYARGAPTSGLTRHELPAREEVGTLDSGRQQVVIPPPAPEMITHPEPEETIENKVPYVEHMAPKSKRSSYRKIIALFGVGFFVVALAVASIIMFWGNNTISGENISISASGPIAVGGGEEFPFQVSIANQNAVPIQSATLIIEYPKGTQSATEDDKEMTIERRQLDSIGTGELVNIELRARVYGEENEEKEINVRIEYRIAGSNATFEKKAEPLRFKISTSPVVMAFDSVKSVSSGQEVELTLTIQSNSPTPLADILVKAVYPQGFDFTKSTPDTVSGEDTWKFTTLKPGEKKTITIKGLMTGYEDEARAFTATAGVANEKDKNTLASQLATARTEISIEQAFLDVNVLINGDAGETAVIGLKDTARVEVKFKNTLDAVIYDAKVEVRLSGNALDEFDVLSSGGFYDSANDTIVWESSNNDHLKEILPGSVTTLTFQIKPQDDVGNAPEVELAVSVKGQRIFENRATEEIVGTAARTIRVESIPTITAAILHSDGPFTNSGPVPPVAEKVTQYTYTIKVNAGANDITGAEVTAALPQYISWLDLVTDGDSVTYNPTTRTMKWAIGDMDARSEEEMSVQVSFRPSESQIGTTPTILETQRFKATDRFTGTVVRTESPALTTSLYGETDAAFRNGQVRATE